MSEKNYTLVLNGSEARLQITVGQETDLLFSQEWFTPRQGMQVLLPALMDALDRMKLSLQEMGRIAVVKGPGSFTGIRLVLSSALGLARPLGIPLAGIEYMPALATDAALLTKSTVWAVTHARRGQVHLQGFSCQKQKPQPVTPATPATLDEAIGLIQQHDASPVLLGTGVRKNEKFFHDALPGAHILPARFDHPTPETLLSIAASLDFSHEPIQPLYLRGCDAEENLPFIAEKKGIDPEKAQSTLSTLTSAPYTANQ